MAIFHMSAQIISRSKGHSSVEAAAYRHGEKLTDEHTGEVHDYTKKHGVSDSVILIPEGADHKFLKPEYLWNTIEKSEKRKDAQLAREFNIALPVELNNDEKKALAIDFCNEHFVKNGMIADIAFHKLDSDNPHFHVMLTTRKLSQDGKSFGQKNRVNDWKDKSEMENLRKGWADTANAHLQKAGIDERIDHRSLADQKAELDALPSPSIEQQAKAISLDRPATIHRGHSGNPERQERFDSLQEVKVSQEAKAQSHIEKNTPSKPSPSAPASSPTASSSPDATQGGDKNPLDKLGKVGEYIQSKIDKEDVSSKQEKQPSNKDSKSSRGNVKAATGSTSDLKLTDETTDKNLHLTEAQKEELEELEADERKVRKAMLSDGGGKLDPAEDYKPQSKDAFISKFKKAKSFTEQRFNEEKESYENSRKKNKYAPK